MFDPHSLVGNVFQPRRIRAKKSSIGIKLAQAAQETATVFIMFGALEQV